MNPDATRRDVLRATAATGSTALIGGLAGCSGAGGGAGGNYGSYTPAGTSSNDYPEEPSFTVVVPERIDEKRALLGDLYSGFRLGFSPPPGIAFSEMSLLVASTSVFDGSYSGFETSVEKSAVVDAWTGEGATEATTDGEFTVLETGSGAAAVGEGRGFVFSPGALSDVNPVTAVSTGIDTMTGDGESACTEGSQCRTVGDFLDLSAFAAFRLSPESSIFAEVDDTVANGESVAFVGEENVRLKELFVFTEASAASEAAVADAIGTDEDVHFVDPEITVDGRQVRIEEELPWSEAVA